MPLTRLSSGNCQKKEYIVHIVILKKTVTIRNWPRCSFDLVQVYVSIQSSGKPIEHFLADDQFSHLSRYFM